MEFKGTKKQWVNGWGNGLTGVTTPVLSPTVDDEREFVPISCGMETIAIVIQPENNSIAEMEANALLISKAIELLENNQMHIDALDLTQMEFYNKYGFNVAELIPKTRQLIKEATKID